MGRKKKLRQWILPAILAVVFINAYAFHEIMQIAENWKMSMLPGNVSGQLTRLAIILAVNCLVIVFLLISKRRNF